MYHGMFISFIFGSSTEPNVSVGLRPKTDRFSRIHFLPLRSKGRKSILEKWVLAQTFQLTFDRRPSGGPREPRGGAVNLGRRRVPRSEILNPINRVESPVAVVLSSACRRFELDSPTPRASGVFRMAVSEGRSLPRKSEKSVKIGKSRPINRPLIRVNRTARRGDRKNVRALRLPRCETWPEARRTR